ncbi:hypothetical protein RCL_jg12826.t1 [Rhizophagus clarus]|uniref:Uncharacterized protein n=1 Tax=Rhizophagus clarus TaxID=94130 RepID=A0A8H3KYH6_9GLOM|nr:hypothetical protein RCL_jg12826.t1 [Rhizophagus clarus]
MKIKRIDLVEMKNVKTREIPLEIWFDLCGRSIFIIQKDVLSKTPFLAHALWWRGYVLLALDVAIIASAQKIETCTHRFCYKDFRLRRSSLSLKLKDRDSFAALLSDLMDSFFLQLEDSMILCLGLIIV